ncbi:Phosphatidylglycerophosphatase A [Candidatus Hoaglandella endobia]|uniref:Phosphatidylglycerophosphatase A n=2 Tax=Candidatus Hoaglandella endobia TaxID=1778263 RepID=A0A143WTP0_9ENTR|nr:Phosphatidylglycerophosphatase A [Candidatus Hoaglandella endobia]
MSPWMPGTIGSLTAIPIWYLLILLPWPLYSLVIIGSIYFGVSFCHQMAEEIGVHDHGCIVWDEFVGMWISLIVLPANNWQLVLAGFVLFRLLDIWKPWPICWFDRSVDGGIGIIIDDIIVGIIVAGILYSIRCYL